MPDVDRRDPETENPVGPRAADATWVIAGDGKFVRKDASLKAAVTARLKEKGAPAKDLSDEMRRTLTFRIETLPQGPAAAFTWKLYELDRSRGMMKGKKNVPIEEGEDLPIGSIEGRLAPYGIHWIPQLGPEGKNPEKAFRIEDALAKEPTAWDVNLVFYVAVPRPPPPKQPRGRQRVDYLRLPILWDVPIPERALAGDRDRTLEISITAGEAPNPKRCLPWNLPPEKYVPLYPPESESYVHRPGKKG